MSKPVAHPTTAQSLGALLKSAMGVMRKAKGREDKRLRLKAER